MISVNELALGIFEDDLAGYPEVYNVEFHQFDNGARLVDCGVNTKGGYLAGKLFTDICMGGLAEVSFRNGNINGVPMPFIDIHTDFPAISCLGSQKAGWTVKVGKYSAMGSGPARALSLMPKHTFEVIEYEDDFDYAVICLESDKLPTEDVMEEIAKKCHVEPANVCAVVAPT
ncbi:MAG: methenyltetrahydromethanopterin cyclohydrolase, partial [Methanomicrobium sp.]|nr:methenyltetrahydromethanopterin cyclohydrolase [Methanomicrobium sp.]